MILEGGGAISWERGTPVASKEVWGKLLNSIALQGGETPLWFRTEALLKLLNEIKRDCWRRLVFEKVLDLLPRHTTPHKLNFFSPNR